MTFEQMQAQKDKNSAAWHGADKATQDRLHQENLSLQSQMDKLTGSSTSFDSGSGTYKPSKPTSAAGGGGSRLPTYSGSGAGGSKIPTHSGSGSKVPTFSGAGSTGGGYTSSSSAGSGSNNPYVSGKDDYGETDWSTYLTQGMASGSMSADDAQYYLDQRIEKAASSGYSQYLNDDIAKKARDYISQKRISEQQEQGWGKYLEMQEQTSAAERAALDAAIKSNIAGLESQKSGITQSAEEAAKQAYIAYMQSQAAMPQVLSAAGYSGGMADSQRLALDTTLQNNQKDILLNRDNTLNDIDTAIQKTKLEGSIQGAQSQAQLGREALSAYLNYINQKNAQASQDYWNKYGYDFQGGQAGLDREHQMGMQQGNQNWQSGESEKDRVENSQQRRREEAINLLLGGYMPPDDMLAAAGIDKSTAQGWFNYSRQQAGRSSGGGGSTYLPRADDGQNDGGNTGISEEQYNAAADRFDAGDYSAEVIDTILAAGKDAPEALAKAAGLAASPWDISGPVNEQTMNQMLSSGAIIEVNIGGKKYYKRGAMMPEYERLPGNIMDSVFGR